MVTATGALVSRTAPWPARLTEVPFEVPKGRPYELRRLRDRLTKEGNHAHALQVALEVARRDPGRESFMRVGILYREVGRYRDAIRTLRDALRFRTGPSHLAAEIHFHLANTWMDLGQKKRMARALRRANSCRPRPRTDSKLHLSLGNFQYANQQWNDALREYENAEGTARSTLDKAAAILNQGLAFIHLGRFHAAKERLDRALRAFGRIGNRAAEAVAAFFLAQLHFDRGQPRLAMSMCLRAAAIHRRTGKRDREAEALQNAGYAAGEIGLPARSRAYLTRAIKFATDTGGWQILVRAYACRSWMYYLEDGFEQGGADLERAQRLLRGRRYPLGTSFVARTRARIAGLFGEWKEMSRAAAQAERIARKRGDLLRVAEFRRLRAQADHALGRRNAATYARNRAKWLEALVGRSAAPGWSRRMERLASTNLPILIVGEDGTGGLELARQVHRSSPRHRRPSVEVACEQATFAASEWAGHLRGAWSGAAADTKGAFARADRGTIILDRVDFLKPEDQRVLLRLLDGYVRPVGSPHETKVDVRVVAVARDPQKLVPALRHRLAGSTFEIAPLRERQEEIPALVEGFLRGRRRITCDALAEMARQPWEGNLSEIQATVERLVTLSDRFVGLKLVRRILKTPDSYLLSHRVYKKRTPRRMALAMA